MTQRRKLQQELVRFDFCLVKRHIFPFEECHEDKVLFGSEHLEQGAPLRANSKVLANIGKLGLGVETIDRGLVGALPQLAKSSLTWLALHTLHWIIKAE